MKHKNMKLKKLSQQLVQSSTVTLNTKPKLLAYSLHKMLWSSLISAMLLPTTLFVIPAYASELDVYEKNGAVTGANSFGPKVMLTLPSSSSLGCKSIAFDNQDIPYFANTLGRRDDGLIGSSLTCEQGTIPIEIKDDDGNIIETLTYVGDIKEYNGTVYESRAMKMIRGVRDLLDDPSQLPPGTSIGLTYFGFPKATAGGYRFNLNNQFNPYTNPRDIEKHTPRGEFYKDATSRYASVRQSGLVVAPVESLTLANGKPNTQHINRLKRDLINMAPGSAKPIAKGYAEATAYMLGSSTLNRDLSIIDATRRAFYPIRKSDLTGKYYMCVWFSGGGDCRSNSWREVYPQYIEPYLDLIDKDSSGQYITETGNASGANGKSGYTYYQYTDVKYNGSAKEKSSVNREAGINAAPSDILENAKTFDVSYISPLKKQSGSQCSGAGAGIYFLTDGFADYANHASPGTNDVLSHHPYAQTQMKNLFTNLGDGETFECLSDEEQYQGIADKLEKGTGSGWLCSLALAKKLNTKNSKYPSIRTAIVGYGKDYLDAVNVTGNYGEITNCSNINISTVEISVGLGKRVLPVNDPKIACEWGSSKFGNGGFYVAKNGKGIAETIVDFANKLVGGDYKPQSGDSLSIGANVTDATKSSSLAYLPLMEPRPGTNSLIWAGNINKYKVKDGSLFDKNDKHIYDSITGQLKTDSTELWNDSATADGGAVRGDKVAGAYAQLKVPSSSELSNTRRVFVENKSGSIQRVSIDGTTPSGVNTLGYNEDTYARQKAHYLLNFLGYDVPVFSPDGGRITDIDYTTGKLKDKPDPLKDISSYVPASPIKMLGGINNSKPQEIIYTIKEEYNADKDTTKTTNTTNVLFGSMDGALHLVDGSTGEEKFAFIPKPIIEDDHSIAALKDKSDKLADGTSNAVGNVSHGIDAPWHVRTRYNRNIDGSTVTLTTQDSSNAFVKVYGGLGRTGVGFYGLNITNADTPSLLFKIDRSTPGFARLGSTWSAPVESKVKFKTSDDKIVTKDVLFISGGYDKCFDEKTFNIQSTGTDLAASCENKGQTYGSAVYMIDADSGALLWSTSAAATNSGETYTQNEHIKYSIVGEVAVIDTNLNGFVDSIYFADLGGQVFRADFDDSKDIKAESSDTTSGWVKGVERVLDTTVTGTADEPYIPLRFYQRPVISAYRFNGTKVDPKGNKLVYVMSVASGDRNNPLAELPQRQANKTDTDKHTPNKLISIWNSDKVKDIKLAKSGEPELIKLSWDENTGLGSDMSEDDKAKLINGTKKGWYDDLTYFSGETSQDTATPAGSADKNAGKKIKSINGTAADSQAGAVGYNINYLKAFGQPALRGGSIYVSVYNRLAYIPSESACAPVPTGVTEAQEYCLPFGKCKDGRGSIHTLGVGLSSANFAGVEDGSSFFTLVTPDKVEFKKEDPAGGTSSATPTTTSPLSAVKKLYHSLYDLLPNVWFERTPEPPTTSTTPATTTGSTDGGS